MKLSEQLKQLLEELNPNNDYTVDTGSMREQIEAMATEAESLESSLQWKPISEIPKEPDSRMLIVACGQDSYKNWWRITAVCFRGVHFRDDFGNEIHPEYYIPLPELPAECIQSGAARSEATHD